MVYNNIYVYIVETATEWHSKGFEDYIGNRLDRKIINLLTILKCTEKN